MTHNPLRAGLTAAALACLAGAPPALAEIAAPPPWLSDSLQVPAPPPRPRQVAKPAPAALPDPDSVAVTRLSGPDRDATGLIPANLAGLPGDLWRGGDSARAIDLLGRLPPSNLPGAQDLLYRLVLTEADPPDRPDDALLLARIDALLRRGALDRAQALIERAGPTTDDLFRRWFDITLLTDSEDRACAALAANPDLTPSQVTRVFCLAREGRWTTAALTLESARALGDLAEADYELLARFLDPALADGAALMPRPRQVTPLIFRLYEAIGEPLATRDLPLAFAWSDLRFVTGWKAQLEAAERLAKTGAIGGNRLLGLYSERKGTISGAIWDRVRAVQALDLALNAGDAVAVTSRLIEARAVMAPAGLEPALAQMMAPRLGRLSLEGPGSAAALRLRLLAGQPPATLPEGTPADLALAQALMTGAELPAEMPGGVARDYAGAFAGAEPAIAEGVGEAILAALTLLAPGAEADTQDRVSALRTLRAAGQEATARRIAADLILTGGRAP